MSKYGSTQRDTIDRDNRNMAAAGQPMSGELESIWSTIDAGSIGIAAAARDVDSLALGGGHFTVDPDLTAGLTFALRAGRARFGKSVVAAGAAAIALASSAINYVEVDATGAVSSNTAGFTVGRARLYQVTTGASSIATTASAKVLVSGTALGSVTGDLLSAAAATKEVRRHAGTANATASFRLIAPDAAAKLAKVSIVVAAAVAADDTNYWTFTLTNKGQAGAGTAVMLATGPGNTTKVTGGSALAGDTRRDLTLAATAADLNVVAGDVLVLTATKTAAAADLIDLVARLGVSFAG